MTATRPPNSSMVFAVIGPMQAIAAVPTSAAIESPPQSWTKLLTVLELVKVIISMLALLQDAGESPPHRTPAATVR